MAVTSFTLSPFSREDDKFTDIVIHMTKLNLIIFHFIGSIRSQVRERELLAGELLR